MTTPVKKISKATGYATRIFTAEYDLLGMIEAYGLENVIRLAKQIDAGMIKDVTKELKQRQNALAQSLNPRNANSKYARWSAHKELERT